MEEQKDSPITVALVAAGITAVIGLFGAVFQSCGSDPATIERERMKNAYIETKVIEANIDATRTNSAVKTQEAIEAARREAERMTNEQLAQELEKRK